MSEPIRMTGMVSGLDTESIVKALTSGYQTKVDKYKKAQTKLSWTQDAWKDVNKKVYSLYTSLDSMRYTSSYNLQKTTVSDTTKASVTANGQAFNGTHTLVVKQLASTASYISAEKLTGSDGTTGAKSSDKLSSLKGFDSSKTYTFQVGSGDTITVDGDTTLSDLAKKLKEAGVNASYDENQQRFYISTKDSKNGITISDDLKDLLGLDEKSKTGQAVIELDGIEYTSDTNNFSVNGLNITAYAENNYTLDSTALDSIPDDASQYDYVQRNGKYYKKNYTNVSITTQTDAQGIYDKIKDFLSNYNDVINELTDLYNADSASDYEPLTDDEKEEMSDKEVEKWEKKIKDSLLRRDTTLSDIMNTMTSSMSKVFEINGKKYSLGSFGIQTKSILSAEKNRQNAYHIDGDEDDEASSSATDKLLTAINEDPEAVTSFMQQLTQGLYKNLDAKMKSTTMKSAYTIYNDKEMASEYSSYTKLISEWETRLSDMEDSYYKKFSKMESTLSELQSNSSSLTGMFS